MNIIDELKKAGLLNLSEHELSEVMFQSTEFMTKFSKETMIPLLKTVISPSRKDNSIIGTFYRIQSWMNSLSSMNKTAHYQGVASGARSLFELLLDILILKKDITGMEIDKYFAFTEIEKFKVAKKLVEFVNSTPSCKIDVSRQRNYIAEPNREIFIKQQLSKLWGKTNVNSTSNFPNHWSGKNLRQRARDMSPDYEEIYLDTYPKLSWFIHSGAIGWDYSAPQFVKLFGLCHDMAQKRFIEALVTTSEYLSIDRGIKDFYNKMKRLRKVPAILMMEKKLLNKKSE